MGAMSVLFASLLFLSPLFFISGYTNSFDLGKNLLVRSMLLAIIFGFAALIVRDGKISFFRKRFSAPITLLCLGILAVFALSTLFSPAALQSFFGNSQRQFGFLSWIFLTGFFLLLLLFLNRRNIKMLAFTLVLSGTIVSFYALFQHFGFDPLFQNYDVDFFEKRVFSTLGNPDFLAQYIAPLIPLACSFFLLSRRWWQKLAMATSVLLFLVTLVLTQSRASFVGLVVAVLIVAVWSLVKIAPKINLKKLFLGFTLLLAAFLFIFFSPLKDTPLLKRFQPDATNIRSVQSRMIIWQSALGLIKDHPLLGTGIDTFAIFFPQYVQPKFFELEETIHTVADREHNELLQFGVWGGLPAMLLYILLLVIVLGQYFRLPKNAAPCQCGIYAAFLVLIAQNQFTFSLLPHYLLFFFFLAAMVALAQKTPEAAVIFKLPSKAKILIIPLAAMLVFVWNETVLLPLRAETAYSRAIFYSPTQQEIIKNLKEAISFQPSSAFLYYELLMRDGRSMDWALDNLEAIEGETVNVLAWRANFFVKKDFEQAQKYFLRALALNPKFLPVLKAYADATFAHGDCASAAARYENYLKYAPPFWRWKFDLKTKTPAQQKSYRIFFKNDPDTSVTFERLAKCYEGLGDRAKADFYRKFTDLFV